jgi:hypothetical protein
MRSMRLPMTLKLNLGKVAAYSKRRVNAVELTLNLREKRVSSGTDVYGHPVCRAVTLSICGNVWNAQRTDIVAGGQCHELIRQLFPADKKVQRICDLWERWHLNDMHTGLKSQCAYVARIERRLDRELSFTERERLLEVAGKSPDPATGYAYGTGWLVEQLPVDVTLELLDLFDRDAPEPVEGDKQETLAETVERLGIECDADVVGNTDHAYKYEVTLRRGDFEMTVDWTQGYACESEVDAENVVAALLREAEYADWDFDEFCAELGYDPDSRKAYASCKANAAKLPRLLGDEYDAVLAMSAE